MDDDREQASETVTSGEFCRVCGAETHGDEPLCRSCAKPPDTIVDDPLPPIPDGGLARTMPDWLRAAPQTSAEPADHPQPAPNAFASILSEDDIPLWLKRMAARQSSEAAPPENAGDISKTEPAPDQAAVTGDTPSALTVGTEPPPTVDAIPPRPLDLAPTIDQQPRRIQMPAIEHRTAIGVVLLAVIAALVVLAIVLFG